MSSSVFDRPDAVSPGVDLEIPGPGAIIAGKYEVERVLGAGGMGVVVAARHVQLGQRVAIKFMRGSSVVDATAVERFLREARAAVALSSEHVAKVADVGTLPNGAPYMIMEYLAGRDLAQVVRAGGPMAIPVAIDAVLQACEALAEAHSLGIVHRDLKPSNLFLTTGRDGRPLVKVLDFGISKAAGFDFGAVAGALTETGMVMGSPGYMSPEQIRNAKSVDARSDVWSLGVILYELLTGAAPFVGDTLGETFARIFSEDPAPIRERRPDVPPELEATILRCLERDPQRRVQSVVDLAPKLARFGATDAALLASRIASFARGRSETVSASDGSTAELLSSRGTQSAPGNVPALYEETGPAWLQSANRPARSKQKVRMTIVALAGLTGLGCLLVFVVASRVSVSPATAASASTGIAAPSQPLRVEAVPIAPTTLLMAPVMAVPEALPLEPSVGDASALAFAPSQSHAPPLPVRAIAPKKPTAAPKPTTIPTNAVPDFGY